MMDGSLEADGKTPASYKYNVAVTREVVTLAHAKGVTVEGELGVLGSLETGMGDQEDGHGAEGPVDREQLLTDPEQAEDFVAATGVDALAVAIGTSHGAYKFSRKPDAGVLVMDRIREIHRRLPNTHLVMHGSSSVPQHLQDVINANGGEMRQTYGVPIAEIQEGIRHGVRKINVDTDNRMAITGAIRQVFHEDPSEFDPRKYLGPCARRHEASVPGAHGGVWDGRPGVARAAGGAGRDGRRVRGAGLAAREIPVRIDRGALRALRAARPCCGSPRLGEGLCPRSSG